MSSERSHLAREMSAEVQRRHWSTTEIILGMLGMALTIALCILAIIFRDEITNTEMVARYGLIGIMVVAFIASSALSGISVIPYWMITFALPSVLAQSYGVWSPVLVALFAALGATLGQSITFALGYGGRKISEKLTSRFSPEFYLKAVGWMKHYGAWAVFLMSVTANPLHLPMTLAIASFRYPAHKFLFFGFIGQLIKSMVLAFAGYYSLNSLLKYAGFTEALIRTVIVIAGVLFILALWQFIVWRLETREKNRKYRAAVAHARKVNLPLLVVGGPWGTKPLRRLFKVPAHEVGDVCLDIDSRAVAGVPCAVVSSVTHIPFAGKSFGAVFSSHVLEHLPSVDDARHAIEELNRVADSVYVVCPTKQSIGGWLTRGHHLWVRQTGKSTYLQQRGGNREKIVVETAYKTD